MSTSKFSCLQQKIAGQPFRGLNVLKQCVAQNNVKKLSTDSCFGVSKTPSSVQNQRN